MDSFIPSPFYTSPLPSVISYILNPLISIYHDSIYYIFSEIVETVLPSFHIKKKKAFWWHHTTCGTQTLCPLCGKHRASPTGPPGKPLSLHLKLPSASQSQVCVGPITMASQMDRYKGEEIASLLSLLS